MISKNNLSVIIVSFASDHVISKCIDTIDSDISIIVIENSNNLELKKNLEKKYKNLKCILNLNNSGMGAGNNLGISKINTEFALILNPDVILENTTINELIKVSNEINDFSILAPIHSDKNYPNFKMFENISDNHSSSFLNVMSVDGYAMLLNLNKIKKVLDIEKNNFFDENIFMYLENDDLCKRLTKKEKNIYVSTIAKIDHLGAKGSNEVYKNEIELSRNWHWIWSKYYYNKKHNGFLIATLNGLPSFFSSIIKFLFYSMINKNFKKKVYKNRCLGFINSLLNKPSTYRPEIQD